MKRIAPLFAFLLLIVAAASAQPGNATTTAPAAKPADADTAATTMAKASLAAHGGDKLAKMTTLVVRGQADINAFGQAIPGAFSMAIAGDRYFFELANLAQPLKQIYNGKDTYSSVPEFALPPMTALGLPLLAKVGVTGYTVSEAKDAKTGKRKGFRITTPDGYFTDFYPDEKTGQIKSYESAYEVGSGQTVTTSVEVDEFLAVDGVLVPKKYAQRFEFGSITAYANFKAKDIFVNSKLDDDVFAFPKKTP